MALQQQPTHDHLLSISHPDMDNEDAQSTDWLDSTNHNVVAVLTDQVGDPWNHPLMMIDNYHAAEEASKRVSLDATETWMTDQDGDDIFLGTLDTSDPILMAHHHHHDGEFAALPSSISFQPDDNDLHLMSMDDGDDNHHHHQYNSHSNQHDPHHSNHDNDDWSDDSWNSQFRERRAQLAASMQASQSTRNLISKHVQTRASLQQVLQEIEKSATQVRQHIVETVGMAVDDEPEQEQPDAEPEPMPDVEPSSSSSDGNVDDNGNTLQVATEPTAAAAAAVAASNPEKPAAV